MKKRALPILGLLLVALPIMLSAVPVQACFDCWGPTSLEVYKVIDCIWTDCNGIVNVGGWIVVRNDPCNPACITDITDTVEAKYKGNNPWTEVASVEVKDWDVIYPGEVKVYWFSISFDPDCYKSFRNVVYVTLANHPEGPGILGEHVFLYRLSFDVP